MTKDLLQAGLTSLTVTLPILATILIAAWLNNRRVDSVDSSLNKRIDALSDSLNRRIDDLRAEIVPIRCGVQARQHDFAKAFIDEQAMQCGHCVSGPILYGRAFIDQNPKATQEQIVESLTGLLCRCHAHVRMVKALVRYAEGVKNAAE